MGTPASQRIQVQGQGGNQSLAFTGAHLCDSALMQGEATNHLNIIVAQPDGAFACLAYGGKSKWQQAVQRFLFHLGALFRISDATKSIGNGFSKLTGLSCERFCVQRFVLRLKPVDLFDYRVDFLHFTFLGISPQAAENIFKHSGNLSGGIIAYCIFRSSLRDCFCTTRLKN